MVELGHGDGRLLSWLYERGTVAARKDTEEGVRLTVRLSPDDVARLHTMLEEQGGGHAD